MLASRFIRHGTASYLKKYSRPSVRRTLYNSVVPLTEDSSEVEIEVPWGKLAGKLWGSKDKQPLLALHGWQDNAGTFDNLAPILCNTVPVLAIDFHGHGLSSWLPPGMLNHEMLYLLVIERLRRHFGWEKVKILAHSFSAQLSFWYTVLFPQETDFVIALDALKFQNTNYEKYDRVIAKFVSEHFKLENRKGPPISYTEGELLSRWSKAIPGNLDEEYCKILMIRGAKRTDDGKYIFSRDPRIKIQPVLSTFTEEYFRKCAATISCPYFFIKTTEFTYIDSKETFYGLIDIMKKNNQHFYYELIQGKHHIHLIDPQAIAKLILPFIEKYNT